MGTPWSHGDLTDCQSTTTVLFGVGSELDREGASRTAPTHQFFPSPCTTPSSLTDQPLRRLVCILRCCPRTQKLLVITQQPALSQLNTFDSTISLVLYSDWT
ncbi:hypothetical protein CC2G_007625 [Coprinopsis cinerea AmutBmut pab1-1]|nr:hypothetical protein CC2G_007625 [Coprinopsis cinerea AmutBmut pab1-1]